MMMVVVIHTRHELNVTIDRVSIKTYTEKNDLRRSSNDEEVNNVLHKDARFRFYQADTNDDLAQLVEYIIGAVNPQ